MKDYNEIEEMIAREEQGYRSVAFPTLMRKVYVWMTLALVITGLTAWGVATSPNLIGMLQLHPGYMLGIVIAQYALVLFLSAGINRLSLTSATLMFILYSVLNGLMFSSIFMVYTAHDIARVFFITAGTFGVMSLIGYTTRTDLSSLGRLLIMLLLGVVIATVVNVFMRSSGFDLILSYITVAIFVGLTAHDTQKMKQVLAVQADGGETAQKIALLGALTLYLDFINLFLSLLRIFGNRN